MKSPEDYLEDKVVLPDQDREEPESPSLEEAFLTRYFSGAAREAVQAEAEPELEPGQASVEEPASTEVLEPPAARMGPAETPQEAVRDAEAGQEGELAQEQTKFVGFFIHGQEYAVPIRDVQEVIKRIPPTRLPMSPAYVSGVISLRSKVTPLVDIAKLMGKTAAADESKEFIIVCRESGLQLGLEVERISTMYHVEQDNLEWSIDAHLDGQGGFLCGLIKGNSLIGIIDVRAMAEAVLQDP